jgi:hypothetical protein
MSTRRLRLAAGAAVGILLALAPAASAGICPGAVDGSDFATKAQLRKLLAQENRFGQRILASTAHRRTIAWIEDEARGMGFEVRSDPYSVYRWQPLTKAKGRRPGLDIGRAGDLQATGPGGSPVNVPDAGAVHWTKPGAGAGALVYLPSGEEITAANAAGKAVIRDFPSTSLPFSAFGLADLYVTPDLASDTGDYARPYLTTMHDELLAAGRAGAAGVVFAFDVPRRQVQGYYDPHTGTLFRVPAVFVGGAEAAQLKALAAQGGSARVAVRAKVDRARTRNLIATLPGRSPQKIVLAANTDGNSWVQENGVVGLLALGRYYADLPRRCRPRTLELVFATAHDTLVADGTNRYAKRLSRAYAKGKVAFAFAIEHLGTRELVPTGEGAERRLRFTGRGEPFLFAAGDSDILRSTAVAATKRRKLDRTAVLQGIGVPDATRVPPICSMGGLGNAFHRRLIPTLAMISGPWTLYDPAFGSSAIDFGRMRAQLLAAGDSLLALDGAPSRRIAGRYPEFRRRLAEGAPTCPPEQYPQFAPGPS